MKVRAWATFVLTLSLAASMASAQSIGVFFSPDGSDCDATLVPFAPGTAYILAILGGAGAGGISGAEFRLEGVPWFPSSNANRTVVVRTYGNPLFGGCTMEFASCQTGTGGVVLLYTIDFFVFSLVGETYFSILRHTTPSNPLFQCPVLILCNEPSSTRLCCAGGQAILNGRPCTVAVEQRSWSQVKELYSN